MSTDPDMQLTVIVGTMVLLGFIGFMVLLLVLNTTRRHRHRAQLAEVHLMHEREVRAAEREATEQTLREVGRELHDNVGQLLGVASMGLSAVIGTGAADPRLGATRDALGRGIEEVRRLGRDLNSDLWQQRSLADAIDAEAQRIERVLRVKAHVLVKGELPLLPADRNTILFRIFQETVNNALKHSGADTLTITLHATPRFALTIADNGRGFDPERTHANGGLVNIRKRSALIGFTAQCTSAPGNGCIWQFEQQGDERV
ncbi:MAG: hypothetical protein IPP83_07155 [Flavobacteriales bacterium]|nr:hypothetical protein [Flavobacteriales bacterium]